MLLDFAQLERRERVLLNEPTRGRRLFVKDPGSLVPEPVAIG